MPIDVIPDYLDTPNDVLTNQVQCNQLFQDANTDITNAYGNLGDPVKDLTGSPIYFSGYGFTEDDT